MSLSYGDFANHNNRLLSLLNICRKVPSFTRTKALHALSITLCCTLQQPVFICNNIICMYGKLGEVSYAAKVFDKMPERNRASFNTIISGYSKCGYVEEALDVFSEMRRFGYLPNQLTVGGLLSCASLDVCSGLQLHGLSLKYGLFMADAFVGTGLLGLYGRLELFEMAEKVFEDMPLKSLETWNHMMTLLGKHGFLKECMFLFRELVRMDACLSKCSFLGVFSGVSCENDLEIGKQLHCSAMKKGLDCETFIVNSLISAYGKCGNTYMAERVFEEATSCDIVSWNAIIGATAKNIEIWTPTEFTLSTALKSCCVIELQQLHSVIVRMGYEDNDYVLSSLMRSYAKNQLMNDALLLLDWSSRPSSVVALNIVAGIYSRTGQYHDSVKLISTLEQPDTVSLNIAIAACSRFDNHREVIELFKHMLQSNIRPDNYTYVSILSMCTKFCDFTLGSSIHGVITKTDFSLADTFVCNVLIDMYGKSGSITSVIKVFEETREKNLITWTALISSFGIHGYGHDAFEKFKEMLCLGFKPDRVSFISMLTACRHSGIVKEGMELFQKMKDYGVEPEMDHYRCAVDLLARNGYLKEAEQLIRGMPFPADAPVWRTFLDGCKRHAEEQRSTLSF
ncbi:hypothetical protein AALP_AA5G233800 [Arabis alpina]|uniref:Pentacotripeptide-repeat region of PRORP domain-containing protein n=1 Tax=Arabis alpina TaxID=50452 RepID=A0A087GYY6_ARAAL|nr:hypothetical protein AALP_AA5G233800 [Arabis alpina]